MILPYLGQSGWMVTGTPRTSGKPVQEQIPCYLPFVQVRREPAAGGGVTRRWASDAGAEQPYDDGGLTGFRPDQCLTTASPTQCGMGSISSGVRDPGIADSVTANANILRTERATGTQPTACVSNTSPQHERERRQRAYVSPLCSITSACATIRPNWPSR